MFGSLKKILTNGPTVDYFLKKGNNNLDLLRLILAFFVIYSHAFGLSPLKGNEDIFFLLTGISNITLADIAVKTFFLISGILVTKSLINHDSIKIFIVSRFFRIYPSYIFLIILTLVIIAPLISTMGYFEYLKSINLTSQFIESLFLHPPYKIKSVFENNHFWSLNGSLWSLLFEVICYVLLCLIYVILKKIKIDRISKAFVLLMSLFAPFILSNTPPFSNLNYNYERFFLPMNFFALGCIIISRYKALKLNIANSLFLFFLYILPGGELQKVILLTLSIANILLFLSGTLLRKIKPVEDLSYGVYIWAFLIQQITSSLLPPNPYLNMAVSSVIVLPVAYIARIMIELPSIKFGRRLVTRISNVNNQ